MSSYSLGFLRQIPVRVGKNTFVIDFELSAARKYDMLLGSDFYLEAGLIPICRNMIVSIAGEQGEETLPLTVIQSRGPRDRQLYCITAMGAGLSTSRCMGRSSLRRAAGASPQYTRDRPQKGSLLDRANRALEILKDLDPTS